MEALAPQGLALQNYASIREQQIGGITQVRGEGRGGVGDWEETVAGEMD